MRIILTWLTLDVQLITRSQITWTIKIVQGLIQRQLQSQFGSLESEIVLRTW